MASQPVPVSEIVHISPKRPVNIPFDSATKPGVTSEQRTPPSHVKGARRPSSPVGYDNTPAIEEEEGAAFADAVFETASIVPRTPKRPVSIPFDSATKRSVKGARRPSSPTEYTSGFEEEGAGGGAHAQPAAFVQAVHDVVTEVPPPIGGAQALNPSTDDSSVPTDVTQPIRITDGFVDFEALSTWALNVEGRPQISQTETGVVCVAVSAKSILELRVDNNKIRCLVCPKTKTYLTLAWDGKLNAPTHYRSNKKWTAVPANKLTPEDTCFIAQALRWITYPKLRSQAHPLPDFIGIRFLRGDEMKAAVDATGAASQPKSSGKATSMVGHIKNGSREGTVTPFMSASKVNPKTDFVSTAKKWMDCFSTRRKKFTETAVDVIFFDFALVCGNVIDSCELDQHALGVAKNFAASDNEVVMSGWIPQDAVFLKITLPASGPITPQQLMAMKYLALLLDTRDWDWYSGFEGIAEEMLQYMRRRRSAEIAALILLMMKANEDLCQPPQ